MRTPANYIVAEPDRVYLARSRDGTFKLPAGFVREGDKLCFADGRAWIERAPRVIFKDCTFVDQPKGTAMTYKQYRRKAVAEMADWHPDFDMTGVSISEHDRNHGSPKLGDKIARNPKDHSDRWLVDSAYFADNFEPLQP